ncbi:fatty acid desaturase [Oxalobacteraceae bacterium CAVE-383]|nr:fatty acid desaturase [Oxalobacteraceae bacterium CAVE-383]
MQGTAPAFRVIAGTTRHSVNDENMITGLFKTKQGFLLHGLALGYAVLAYTIGLAGLFSGDWRIDAIATLVLAHGMIISAYMLHECAHNTIFKKNEHNATLGRMLMWLNGSCYGTYEDVRHKHFRHHVDNGDLCWFEYRKWFERHPLMLKLVLFLEYMFIPAQEVLMHIVLIFGSFIIPQRKSQRMKNVLTILIRGGLYGALLWFHPAAAALYAVAYLIMLTVLRFMDTLQHDYAGTYTLFDKTPLPFKGDRDYEQAHTFSNPLSLKYRWVNLLVLNFGYHNAHHSRSVAPWYQLPALHREMYGERTDNAIPFIAQLQCYCRYRVARVMVVEEEMSGTDYMAAVKQGRSPGINAVSFLTAF